MHTAATRLPSRSCRAGAASITTPTPSCPDTYGIATGTGYVPRAMVTSGSASAATVIRRITQSPNGSMPGPHRHPAAHVHAQAREIGGGGFGDLVEHQHVGRFPVPVDAPGLHAAERTEPTPPGDRPPAPTDPGSSLPWRPWERGGCGRASTPPSPPIAGITVVGFVLRLAVLVRPIGVIDKLFIPDDTYYTLTIARSLANGHGPTVDGTRSPAGSRPCSASCWCRCSGSPTTPTPRSASISRSSSSSTPPPSWCSRGWRTASPDASPRSPRPRCGRSRRWRCRWRSVGSRRRWRSSCSVALVALWMWANDRPSTGRAVVVGVVAGLAVLARIDTLLLVALLGALQLWRGPAPAGRAGRDRRARWCSRRGGSGARSSSARRSPRAATPRTALAPVQPFSRESMAQVAGAVAGGPFDVWRSLREWLERPSGRRHGRVLAAWCWRSSRSARGGRGDRVMPQLAVAALPGVRRGVARVLRVVRRRVVLHALPGAGGVRRRADPRGRRSRACGARAAPGASPRSSPPRSCSLVGVVAAVRADFAPPHRDDGDELGVRQRHRLPRRGAGSSPQSRRTGRSSARGRAARSASTPTTASRW